MRWYLIIDDDRRFVDVKVGGLGGLNRLNRTFPKVRKGGRRERLLEKCIIRKYVERCYSCYFGCGNFWLMHVEVNEEISTFGSDGDAFDAVSRLSNLSGV